MNSRKTSKGRFRLLITVQVLWFLTVGLLAGWWGWLLLQQSQRIQELESSLGQTSSSMLANHRMLFWESSAFLALILGFSAILMWLYLQEMKRSRSLRAFFASVTHELKTPLTSIRLQSEALANVLPQKDGTSQLLNRLSQDTQRLQTQVEKLLELARLEGGGQVPIQRIDLGDRLQKAVHEWKDLAGSKMKISSRITHQNVLADETALALIFRNLLENSFVHSGKDKVDVSLTSQKKDRWVVFSYEDRHSSAMEESSKKLGTLFHRGKTSRGAGVGLYLVRILMERMGGKAHFGVQPQIGFQAKLWFQVG